MLVEFCDLRDWHAYAPLKARNVQGLLRDSGRLEGAQAVREAPGLAAAGPRAGAAVAHGCSSNAHPTRSHVPSPLFM